MGLFDRLKSAVPPAPVAAASVAVAVTATGRSNSVDTVCTTVTATGRSEQALVRTVREITGVELADMAAPAPALALREQRLPERSNLKPAENKEVDQKVEFLHEIWQRWKSRGLRFEDAVASAVADRHERWDLLTTGGKLGGSRLSVANAHNWFHDLGRRANGEPCWENAAALADHYSKGQREIEIDADFLQRFIRLYLSPGERTTHSCWKTARNEYVADGMAGQVAPFHQVDYYARTRLSDQVKLRARSAKDYKALIKGFATRYRNFGPGDVWFADHRLCDFWIRHPHPETGEMIAIRPYVTAVMDAFTGRILAWVLYADQNPNWHRIAEAFALALHNAGNRPPMIWYTDNGKDFLKLGWGKAVRLITRKGELLHEDGKPFDHSVCLELGTKHQLARGYNGQEKPIERLFRDQAMDFDRMQPGFCGNCPANRPDYGDTWQGDISKLPTLGQVLEQLAAWVDGHNAERTSSKPSANELWAAAEWTRPAFSDERLTMALLLPSRTALQVGRTGYGLGGIHYAGGMYTHAALREWNNGQGLWGEYVMVKTHWALPDVQTSDGKRHPPAVFVYHPDGRFICMAMAEVQVAEIAQTETEKALLGEVCKVIAHAAKADSLELERHTGSRRVVQTRPLLPAGSAGGDGSVALGAGGLGSRRLPAGGQTERRGERPVPTSPVSEDLMETVRSVIFPSGIDEDADVDVPVTGLDYDFSEPTTAAKPAAAAVEDITATLAQLQEY